MIGRSRVVGLVLACVGVLAGSGSAGAQVRPDADAQAAPTDAQAALARQVESRFDVLPLSEGVALRPRRTIADVRSIEISGGTIAINGSPVTGAELRDVLGDDAGLVMQLSYLDEATRRQLFVPRAAPAAPAIPPEPSTPLPETPAAPPVPVEPPAPTDPDASERRRSRDRIRFGGGITIDEDELITGDVAAFGGPVRVRGEVRGQVVAVGGGVELGPTARVRGDVITVGGRLQRDPGSQIGGEIHEIGVGEVDLRGFNWARGAWNSWSWGSTFGSAFALLSTLIRVAVMCVLAALVILLAREHVEWIGTRAASEPLKAGAVGFLSQLLFLPILVTTVIILVLTLIGIPLLVFIPFLVLGLLVVALVGFTAVGHYVGQLFGRRMGWAEFGPYAATVVGILLIVSPLLFARLVGLAGGMLFPMTFGLRVVAWVVEYAAWTVGFGAVALAWFNRRRTSPAIAVP